MSAEVGHLLDLVFAQVQPSESGLGNAADIDDFVLADIQSLQNGYENLNQLLS